MVLMAMLGGTYIFGGRGSILGTFLAAWLLSVISTGMLTAEWLPATHHGRQVSEEVVGSMLGRHFPEGLEAELEKSCAEVRAIYHKTIE